MIKLILLILLSSCTPCIVDVYHPKSDEQQYVKAIRGNVQHCLVTLTKCDYACPTEYLKRGGQYRDWAKGYTKLGLPPPHPERNDNVNAL